MSLRPWRPFLLLSLMGVLLFSGCEQGGGGSTATIAPGTPAPPVQAAGWINGPGPTAAELAGKVVVIDVWAHWCGPCRAKVPHLIEVYNQVKKRPDVVFLGLTDAEGDDIPLAKGFVKSTRIPWANGWGAGATMEALNIQHFPTLIVIGRDGKVFWNDDRGGSLEDAIGRALAAPEPDL